MVKRCPLIALYLNKNNVLDGIVFSAVCNLERFIDQVAVVTKEDNVIVLDKFLFSG